MMYDTQVKIHTVTYHTEGLVEPWLRSGRALHSIIPF